MKLVPDNLNCDLCMNPATIQLHDASAGTDHLYCEAHRPPDLWPGKNQHLRVKRFRFEPGNLSSKSFAADEDSPEHRAFRDEMCELQILGGEGACRYYLSKLTNSDQFALWYDEFIDNMREFIVTQTNGAAAQFPFDAGTVGSMAPFLKHAFALSEMGGSSKQTKRDRAVVLLLNHPQWSDERIAKEVPTTTKQLQRNTNYTTLRSSLARL